MAQRSSCPQLSQAQGPGPRWHLPTAEAVLPVGWTPDPLTVGSAHSRLSAGKRQMLGGPTVEAACLPRPRHKPLPSSLRSSPLPGTYITQGFPSGDPKPPTSSPPSRTASRPWLQSQPACLARGQVRENSGRTKRYLGWGRVEGKSFRSLPRLPELGLQEEPGMRKGD